MFRFCVGGQKKYRAEKAKFIKLLAEYILKKDESTFDMASSKANDVIGVYVNGQSSKKVSSIRSLKN